MLAFLKNLWQKPEKLIGPSVSFTYNNYDQTVNIAVDWPEQYPEHILKKQFATMLLALQTGNYHKTIVEAIIKKSQPNNLLSNEIIESIHKMSNEGILGQTEEDPVLMWPSNVFGSNQGNQQ